MVPRALILVVIFATQIAQAEPCPPAAALSGDDELVHAVRTLLEARGIAAETPRCPATRAHLERRGRMIVVAVDRARGAAARDGVVERKVSEATTARDGVERNVSETAAARDGVVERNVSETATARDGVEGKIGETATARDGVGRKVGETATARDGVIEREVSEVSTAATVIESWTRSDVAAPLLESRAVPAEAVERAPAATSPPAARGIQLFAGSETSFASDRTVWQGMQL
jgi:hypothetical protein